MNFHNLALPTFSTAPSGAAPVAAARTAGVKRKRPNAAGRVRSSNNLDRELDADDDIDIERDLVAPPTSNRPRRELDEDYGEEGDEEEDREEDDGTGDEDEDDDEEGEQEGGVEGRGGDTAGAVERKKAASARKDVQQGSTAAGTSALNGRNQERPQGVASLARRRQARPDGRELQDRDKKRKMESFMLRGQMDAEQAKRFDAFQSVVLPKYIVRKVSRELYDQFCPQNLGAFLASLSKIFIAELVEIAKDLQPSSAHPTGPLRPYHLKLARMVLEEQKLLARDAQSGSVLKPKKALFRR